MADRKMKKWLPFASLVEQGEILERMIYQKFKTDKPQVSIEQGNRINRILKEYDFKSCLNVTLYFDGYIYKLHSKIAAFDLNKKVVYFPTFYLPLKNIIDIESTDQFDEIC